MSGLRTSWLLGDPPRDDAGVRLFCFPYAGGGASAYHRWRNPAPPGLAIVPVQLPGRENRLHEPAERNLSELIARLVPALDPWFDRPFAFFGHSMGALIAFELARALARRGTRGPSHLFVSARPAPQIPASKPPIHQLPDAEFVEELRALAGTPDAVLQHPELMAVVLPTLRADFALVETYRYIPRPPLDVPITSFAGSEDTMTAESPDAWRHQTTGAFRVQMIEGGHFVLQSQRERFLDEIGRDLKSSS